MQLILLIYLQPIPHIPLYGASEKIGSVFADVVALVFVVGDAIEAAKAAQFVGSGAVKAVLEHFKPRLATAAEGVDGYFLEAKSNGNTVQIFREGTNGEPVGIGSKEEYKDLKESTGEHGMLLHMTSKYMLCILHRLIELPSKRLKTALPAET